MRTVAVTIPSKRSSRDDNSKDPLVRSLFPKMTPQNLGKPNIVWKACTATAKSLELSETTRATTPPERTGSHTDIKDTSRRIY